MMTVITLKLANGEQVKAPMEVVLMAFLNAMPAEQRERALNIITSVVKSPIIIPASINHP